MLGILLTKDQGKILGPISTLLGYLMEGIFNVLDFLNIPNTGLAIILFTIIMYLLMLPLTIKQQKFSKLSAKMNPEIQAVQAKYKNRKDADSAAAMNSETQEVYAKYGVSPSGSCVQLLIQMPILFALYRVIGNMPAYVSKIKEAFFPLVDNLIVQEGSAEFIQNLKSAATLKNLFENESFTSGVTSYVQNVYIDVLNKATTLDFLSITEKYPTLSSDVSNTVSLLGQYNNFLGINIGNSPSFMVSEAMSAEGGIAILSIIAAFIIPVLSAITQFINVKLMPQQNTGVSNNSDQQNTMGQSMKMMNNFMPIMSAFFCYSLPAGMGLYWIAGSVVRSIQQVVINKYIDKIDLDELIKKNVEKKNKKLIKSGIDPKTINRNATLNTRNVANITKKAVTSNTDSLSQDEKEKMLKKSSDYYDKGGKKGSLTSKANMVKQFNDNNKKTD